MKNILTSIFAFLALNMAIGQKEYDELRILYADGNYVKLVKAAEKLTLDDKTKKDPYPYLWLSKGLYKIHISGNSDAMFKNAYKESLNALGKFLKFDRNGNLQKDTDISEYIDMVQGSLVEQIENDLSSNNFRKAFSWVNTYKKVTNNPLGQMYLEGACKFRTDDKSSALSLWKTADDKLKSITSLDEWTTADKEMLKHGAIQTAECYVAIKKLDNAKSILNKVAQWFEEDEAFKEVYDKIVN